MSTANFNLITVTFEEFQTWKNGVREHLKEQSNGTDDIKFEILETEEDFQDFKQKLTDEVWRCVGWDETMKDGDREILREKANLALFEISQKNTSIKTLLQSLRNRYVYFDRMMSDKEYEWKIFACASELLTNGMQMRIRFGSFINDEKDFEKCMRKVERLSKWMDKIKNNLLIELKQLYEEKKITLKEFNEAFSHLSSKHAHKIGFYCFRVKNDFNENTKEEFLQKFKMTNKAPHPLPHLIQPIKAKICMGFEFLSKEDAHPHPYIIDENGKCKDANGKKGNFYAGLVPLDLFAFAIDFEDMTYFDSVSSRAGPVPHARPCHQG